MRVHDGRLSVSPTDLSTFLSCRHKAGLDLAVATEQLAAPEWTDPHATLLAERGEEHESRYVESLRLQGLTVADLSDVDRNESAELTRRALQEGVDVVVQATLADETWLRHADG